MYVLFLLLLVFILMFMCNLLYLWIMMEMMFFMVVLLMIIKMNSYYNMQSVIYYVFIQATSGLLFLLCVMFEYINTSNLYMVNLTWNNLSYWLSIISLFIKLSLFPFYLQVIRIMSFLNLEQGFIFLVFPKFIPFLLLYEMLSMIDTSNFILYLVVFVFLISSTQGLLSSDIRIIMSWSSISQLGWLLVSVYVNLMIFFLFYFMYVLMLYFLFKFMTNLTHSIYFNMNIFSFMMSSSQRFFIYIMWLSGLAPFLFFYIKVVLFWFLLGNSSFIMGFLVYLSSIGILFFYTRLMQNLMSVSVSMGGYQVFQTVTFSYSNMMFFIIFTVVGFLFML